VNILSHENQGDPHTSLEVLETICSIWNEAEIFVDKRGKRTSNLVEYLDDIECVATNGAAICFLRPFPQTFVVQNMIAGFDQSNRLLNGCGAGMGSWQVCGRGRHCSRISKIIVNTRVRNDIQVLQTDNALVSHADGLN
jgi:hypothetical protein